MLIAITVLVALSTFFSFLTLARTGRLLQEHCGLVDLLIFTHNFNLRKFSELGADIGSTLDCLVSVDAKAASDSEQR